MSKAERAAALHSALDEWKNAGGLTECVVWEILELVEDACRTDKPEVVMSLENLEAYQGRIRVLEMALNDLLPGLILDLRHADLDDDKEAMESRIKTVTEALNTQSMTGAVTK